MKVIGHRGARNEAPENTVAGFIHAQKNGCQHFELDLQLSADGQLVVYHDRDLMRTSGVPGKIKHTPYSTLRITDARHNTPGWHSPCYIPHLQDVIDAVPKTLSWQLEVKSDHRHVLKIVIRRLIDIFADNELNDHATVTSSNRWFLAEIKRLAPNIKTGYVAEFRYRRPLRTAVSLGCNLLVINDSLLSSPLLRKAKKFGLEVSVWTVNDLRRIEALQIKGVDSIITDIPSSVIRHLQ